MIKERLKTARSFYNTLDFNTASKVGAIVTKNKKLESTAQGKEYVVAGISLFPAFKGSCSHSASCSKLCIGFTGVSQMMKGSTNCNLSNVDKAMLKRLWLFNNKQDYFYRRANSEIEIMSVYGEMEVMFREISSECIDFRKFLSLSNVTTYGYFKNPAKILQDSETRNVPQKAIYSWNENSKKDFLDLCKYVGMPVSVVVPKKLHKEMLKNNVETDKVVIHNGDISDLESHESYKEGKLNIHLLSEKTARYSNIIERPKFLDSYKSLLNNI
jgi:hypothetical protein